MKLLFTFLLAFSLQSPARSYSQGITLKLKDAPLEKVFKLIEQQTKFRFVYSQEAMKEAKPVSIEVINESLENVLRLSFTDQSLGYSIQDNFIIIKVDEKKKAIPVATIDIRGKVVNENEEPLAGVTITAPRSNKATATNEHGEFYLRDVIENDVLIVTSVGFYKQEIPVNRQTYLAIQLKIAVGSLDETIIVGYGTTTKRLNTGNITKVTSEEISNQPVTNLLGALEGRVPGLVVSQTSGVPGSAFKVQIRGQNSIGISPGVLPSDNPLFIIDGVPFAPGNDALNLIRSASNPTFSAGGGISPFNFLNPGDIESIEVLKDADATSIYGSRGANGVILITTKKGQTGKSRLEVETYTGISKIGRSSKMLNTQQYLQMRHEAFANDGVVPDISNAPDLFAWDTTRYTDFKDLLIGGTAEMYNARTSLSGGNVNNGFLITGSFNKQTTVFPGNMSTTQGSLIVNLNHASLNKKLNVNLSSIYSYNLDNLSAADLTGYIYLPPNSPKLYDSTGKLNWREGGVSFRDMGFENPLANLLRMTKSEIETYSGNILLSYNLFSGLTIKSNFGYNTVGVDEMGVIPNASLDPLSGAFGSSQFANSKSRNWNIEPQIEYQRNILKGKLNALAGGTLLKNQRNNSTVSGFNYSNDALIESITGAGNITSADSRTEYKYASIFGRLNYEFNNKYVINLSARRDGSSRFGNENQFANFGSIGGAWILSEESFFKKAFPFINFGKLRGSYGTTGNDQIPDYQYLDSWLATFQPYNGSPALAPARLYNPQFAWEINRKFEAALELEMLKDRLTFSLAYYRNICGNQLISYKVPMQSGFSSVLLNFPAKVQNSGVEIFSSARIIKTKDFDWSVNLNISIPKNKLISFPGLATSSYANTLKIGKSLSVIKGYHFLGVDSSGIYQFEDVNKDGVLTSKYDYLALGDRDAKFYGGFQNSVRYKNWEFQFFLDFRKQSGRNYFGDLVRFLPTSIPGFYTNQISDVLNRWRQPGDISTIQKFTSQFGTPAMKAYANLAASDGIYTDASFVRLKNISFRYSLNSKLLKRLKISAANIFINAENILTITRFEGADPETQSFYSLPPLRTIVFGIQLTL